MPIPKPYKAKLLGDNLWAAINTAGPLHPIHGMFTDKAKKTYSMVIINTPVMRVEGPDAICHVYNLDKRKRQIITANQISIAYLVEAAPSMKAVHIIARQPDRHNVPQRLEHEVAKWSILNAATLITSWVNEKHELAHLYHIRAWTSTHNHRLTIVTTGAYGGIPESNFYWYALNEIEVVED